MASVAGGSQVHQDENLVLVGGIVVVLVLVVAFGFDFEDEFEDEDEHDVRGCQGQRQGQAIGSTVNLVLVVFVLTPHPDPLSRARGRGGLPLANPGLRFRSTLGYPSDARTGLRTWLFKRVPHSDSGLLTPDCSMPPGISRVGSLVWFEISTLTE